MSRSAAGPILIVAGAVLALIGLLLWLGLLSWFGRLPGDIRIERPNFAAYLPITSMLVVSVAVSLLAMLVRAVLSRHR
jgi:hypothetical protein